MIQNKRITAHLRIDQQSKQYKHSTVHNTHTGIICSTQSVNALYSLSLVQFALGYFQKKKRH